MVYKSFISYAKDKRRRLDFYDKYSNVLYAIFLSLYQFYSVGEPLLISQDCLQLPILFLIYHIYPKYSHSTKPLIQVILNGSHVNFLQPNNTHPRSLPTEW